MFNYGSLNEFIGMLLFWAAGLYVLTRSPRSLLSGAAAATLFSVALWFFGSVMRDNIRDLDEFKAWGSHLWWTAGVALAFWYWTSVIALHREPESNPGWYRRVVAYPLGVVVSLAAIGFGIASVAGDSMLVFSEPVPEPRPPSVSGSWALLPGDSFRWFAIFAYSTVSIAFLHLLWIWRRLPSKSPSRPRLRWLSVSGMLFVAGTTWLATNTLLTLGLPHLFGIFQPGYVILTVGLVILGWSVVRHGAWIEGKPTEGDFSYFLVGQGLLVALYIGLFIAVRLPLNISSLVLFLTIGLLSLSTHALADIGRITLGKVFYRRTPEKWLAMERLLGLARRVTGTPNPSQAMDEGIKQLQRDWWYKQTDDAVNCLGNPLALSELAIVGRLVPDGGSPLESARTVGDLIVACMKKLEPGDGRPPPRPYLILTGAYVEGRTTRELMNTYQIPEKSYYNERRKGVAAIAAELQSIARP